MKQRIYKVKYARHKTVVSAERIPYDLWYVIPLPLVPIMDRMFDYWWELPCDEDILEIIKDYPVDVQVVLPDNGRKTRRDSSVLLKDIIPWDQDDYVLGVPTYGDTGDDYPRASIQYLWTCHLFKNTLHAPLKTTIDEVKLHMPGRVVQGRCSKCIQVLRYYKGVCSPGNAECRRTIKIYTPNTLESADAGDLIS